MLRIFKTIDDVTGEIDEMEDGAWIYMVSPTPEEIETVRLRYNVDESHMKAALDEEESPRIDVEDESTLFIIDVPVPQEDPSGRLYGTIPIGIIIAKESIISICTKDVKILTDLIKGRMKGFYTYKKTRIILQIMYKVATYFLLYLKQIDRVSVQVERELHKSMKNKELIQLLSLEKSLVYFTTSLRANEMVFEKMLRLDAVKKYQDDKELLEDVIIENKQAIEMANIYSNILSGTMDAFASVISNNLNIVMKVLTSITIVMAIPTIIASLFGMNVPVPFAANPMGFWIIIFIASVMSFLAALVMVKKQLF